MASPAAGPEQQQGPAGMSEAAAPEGSSVVLVPTRERVYRRCGKFGDGIHPLHAVAFNFVDDRFYDHFAIAGGNRVTIYKCLENGSFECIQSHEDDDEDESLYTLSWACGRIDVQPLLVVAGSNGIITVFNCASGDLEMSLEGHDDSINEVATQPLEPSLIISAGEDESIRLWNVHTGVCVVVFAGAGGHRNDVLSVDFHPTDINRFASGGMDNTVRIWSMEEYVNAVTDYWPDVDKSYSWTDTPSNFPTKYADRPVLVASVHTDYVDCVRWAGEIILSKSVENEIVLWDPRTEEQIPGKDLATVEIVHKYPVPECDAWSMKFSCDLDCNQLAIGNRDGEIFVWDLDDDPPSLIARLTNEESKLPVWQTAVSSDGRTILAAGEDGLIWRWDEVDESAGEV